MKYPIYIEDGIFQYELGEIEIHDDVTDPVVAGVAIIDGLRTLADELTGELISGLMEEDSI